MQQFQAAQNNFRNLLSLQAEGLKESSNNVSSQYLKLRTQARSQSSVSDNIISDLSHQIRVLENIRDSGMRLEPRMQDELQNFISQYQTVKNELEINNEEIIEKGQNQQHEQQLGLDLQSEARSVCESDQQREQGILYSEDSFPNDFLPSKKDQKWWESEATRTSCKRYFFMCLEYANSGLFAFALIYSLAHWLI